MGTKVARIESDCEDIIRKYAGGGSLTDGIRAMEKRILDNELTHKMTSPDSWIPGANVEDGMSKEYWVRFRKEVDKVVVQYAGR